jgi:hypothetical protein
MSFREKEAARDAEDKMRAGISCRGYAYGVGGYIHSVNILDVYFIC